jgi:hypothetical protein
MRYDKRLMGQREVFNADERKSLRAPFPTGRCDRGGRAIGEPRAMHRNVRLKML